MAVPVPAPAVAERPSWLATATTTAVGLLLGLVMLAVPWVVLALVGITGYLTDAHDPLGLPLPLVDAWALLADAFWLSFTSLTLAWCVRLAVRGLIRWDLRLGPLAAAIALGWLTVPGDGMVVALALVVVVVRQVALVPRPAPRRRPRRAVAIASALAAGLLLVAAATYRPLHPLVSAADLEFTLDHRGASADPWTDSAAGKLELIVVNHGLAGVTLDALEAEPRSVNARLPQPTAALFATLAYRKPPGSSGVSGGRPLAGTVLGSGEPLLVSAALRPRACTTGQSIFTVEAVTLRMHVFGLARSQRFALEPSAELHCR